MKESAPTVDLLAAVAGLLTEPGLREVFARNSGAVADQLRIRDSDRAAFLQLRPGELEAQARTLVRKRYENARAAIPRSCERHRDRAWSLFERYARSSWINSSREDVYRFCLFLRENNHELWQREFHRAAFDRFGRRFAVHLVTEVTDGRRRTICQFLLRWAGRRHELSFYLRL